MKTKNIFKKYGLIVFAIFVVVFFTATIALNEIQEYNVDVMEKSPVFPYQNYDYMTTEDTFYSIDKEYSVVPSYFRTDFASIPRVLWFIDAPYKASFIYPALWHDYNYSCPSKRTRKQIDDIFFWLLRNEQNSLYTSLKMYLAVRIFGMTHFNENGVCEDIVVQIENDEQYYKQENINHG
tara:strand:- start:1352 stop:1891 length:540 start_codon:yes stop_codon:yes gene_type:complete